MRCSSCSQDNRAGVSFCERCGASLTEVTAPTPDLIAECGVCGFANRLGISFCERCGASLAEPVPSKPRRRWRVVAAAASVVVVAAGSVGGVMRLRDDGGSTAADLVARLPDPAEVVDCTQLAGVASQFLDAAVAVEMDPEGASLQPEVANRGEAYHERMAALGCDGEALLAELQEQPVPGADATVEEITRFLVSGGDVDYPVAPVQVSTDE